MEIDFQTFGLIIFFGVGLWYTYGRGFEHGYDTGHFEALDDLERQGVINVKYVEADDDDRGL